jgi:hypothetical protein
MQSNFPRFPPNFTIQEGRMHARKVSPVAGSSGGDGGSLHSLHSLPKSFNGRLAGVGPANTKVGDSKMDIANLRKAANLAAVIETVEHTLAAYRAADLINVSLPENKTHLAGNNAATLTAAEIGDAIVVALQHRLAKMRGELTGLGVTVGEAADAGRP